ncbi:prominin-1-A-like [Dysidea avara]|uniref:prominin-1-A-like n=1 Tax=Dysidea avara TaxID=196820 RepID=UPI00331E2637
MKVLWACLVALCSCSLGLVDSQTSCNISLGGHDSVPELCLSIQEEAAVSTVLNFTLAENGSIIFASLPPTRQVSVSVNDDSDGLRGWTSIANSFVDSVRSGSLPYDIILPVLNSSVDSPITTSSCVSTQQRTGSGDFTLQDVLEDFGEWWAPILVVTCLGPVFALLFIIVGCCFCCCRLCGKCGGSLKQEYRDKNDLRCFILYIMLVLCVCLLFIGVVFAFVSNEKLNNSIQGFNTTVNTAIDDSLNFIDDTQMQANATIDRYDEINTFVQCQVENSHLTIGIIVVDVFEGAVAPLINSSLELATDLNNTVAALRLINSTVVKLLNLTQRLQTELNGVTAMLQALQTSCVAAGVPACNTIPTQSYTVTVNFAVVDDVTSVLDRLVVIEGLKEQVLEANATFYSIPCDIKNQIQGPAEEIINQANIFRDIVRSIANDIEREVRNIINEERFVGDIRTQSSDIQEELDKYDTPRYAISVTICSLTLIVIIILIVGLLLGAVGFRRTTEPSDRTQSSHYGGITLIYCGVPLMFIFAVILLLLTSITFFLGANMLKVCYSISEDPPNDDIPSYELYSRIVDNSDLWGGYLLGCYILDDSRIPLTVTDMLNGCRANQAVYEVARLRLRRGLNLDGVINITNQIPNLDGLFDDLRGQINFDLDQILTPEARNSITSFTNAGLQAIDYATYITQITSQISTLTVDSTISTLVTVRNGLVIAGQTALADDTQDIIDEIIRINQTTITEINNCTQLLEQQIIMLNETAVELSERVQEILVNANATVAELNGPNGTQLVLNRTEIVLNRVITFATDFANWAIDNLENEIGRCQPLYAAYSNLYYEACKDAVDGINAFWLAIGWCVLFFIPSLVFSVWLSHYLRRTEGPQYLTVVPYDQVDSPGQETSYFQLKEV